MQCIQKCQGQQDSGRLPSTFENPSLWNQRGLSLVQLLPGSARQRLGKQSSGSCVPRLWGERLSTPTRGPGSPHISVSSTAEQGDSANDNCTSKWCCNQDGPISIFARSKNKTKTPTEEAHYLCLVFARISEKVLWSKAIGRLRMGMGFQDLFWNYSALYLPHDCFKASLAGGISHVNNSKSNNNTYWVVTNEPGTVLNI